MHLDLSVARSLPHIWLMIKHVFIDLQHTCVVLRAHCVSLIFVWIFCLALKAPGQDNKFPNEFDECVSGYMLPTARHTVRAYYRAILSRGCLVDRGPGGIPPFTGSLRSSLIDGSGEGEAVSYTHLTLPTNREV